MKSLIKSYGTYSAIITDFREAWNAQVLFLSVAIMLSVHYWDH